MQAIIDSGKKEIESNELFDEVIVIPNGANEMQELFPRNKE